MSHVLLGPNICLCKVSLDELESLLREKDRALQSNPAQSPQFASPSIPTSSTSQANGFNFDSVPFVNGHGSSISNNAIPGPYGTFVQSKPNDIPSMDFPRFPSNSSLDNLAGVASMLGSAPMPDPTIDPVVAGLQTDHSISNFPTSTSNLDLVFTSWPANLPNREVTRHLYVMLTILHAHTMLNQI